MYYTNSSYEELIGETREDVLNELGTEYMNLTGTPAHDHLVYPTRDGYIVVIIIDDATKRVERILVFDLLDLNTINRTIS